MANMKSWSRRAVVTALPVIAGCAALGRSGVGSDMHLTPVAAVEFAGVAPTQATFEERMEHYGVPGLSVALASGGRATRTLCWGVRDAGEGARVDADTVLQAASIGKAVTAVGALALVQDGAIGLDDDVRRRLPGRSIPFAAGVADRPVTLRQLLSHTAGVNAPSYDGLAPGARWPSLGEILDGADGAGGPRVEVATAAGAYRYSGGGFELIEAVIENCAGQPFERVMHERVFAKLGMERTTFEPVPPAGLRDDIASGHSWVGARRDTPWLVYPQRAAASLWSTPSNLCRLLSDVSASWRGSEGDVLSAASAHVMMTEVASGMGLGFGVQGEGRAKIISHAGWTRGYRSYLAAFPATGEAIVVMANGDRGNELAMEVVRGAARSLDWPGFAPRVVRAAHPDAAALEALTGSYAFADAGFSVDIARADDHLVVSTPRGARYTFYAMGEGGFVAVEDGETAAFSRADGRGVVDMWGMRGVR
jgi:CubicO group peptidase (beta-lactamase class C family)